MGLRVLYDGYWLHDGPPSGRNVGASVLRAWAQEFPGDELEVAVPVPDDVPVPLVDALPVARRHVPTPVSNHQLWVRTRLGAAAAGADAVVSQNFLPGPQRHGVPSVVLVYDLIFREHPEWFTLAERVYLRGVASAMRGASAVVTISETERRRIQRHYPAAARRVRSIGLGLPSGLEHAVARPVERGSDRPFLLSVGRLNVRKNLGRLIEAYTSSPALTAAFDLVIVGETNGRAAELGAAAAGPGRVDFLGGVDDAQLKWLYRNTALFAFPSLDEGFGLPLLEARSLGAPSAVSDIPVFHELGFADAYFDPSDVASIRAVLEAQLAGGRPEGGTKGDPSRYAWANVARGMREQLTAGRGALEAAS
ncbi:hypothetical protein GCM10022288_11980 [Gryllotalpicola kribbensis]|uniref:D-inositol 3-phosphate glycosyltransferase n=1 Tax=Gryllotalpicola kribbensis TaxID=993084 RepID=A0ABP8AP66_9MICO